MAYLQYGLCCKVFACGLSLVQSVWEENTLIFFFFSVKVCICHTWKPETHLLFYFLQRSIGRIFKFSLIVQGKECHPQDKSSAKLKLPAWPASSENMSFGWSDPLALSAHRFIYRSAFCFDCSQWAENQNKFDRRLPLLHRSFSTHTKKYRQTLILHVQRNDFCVITKINSCRKINEILFFSPLHPEP